MKCYVFHIILTHIQKLKILNSKYYLVLTRALLFYNIDGRVNWESIFDCGLAIGMYLFFKKFIWLHWILVETLRILNLCCSMWTLSCGMWDLIPWPGIKLRPLAMRVLSLNHWTTREVPMYFVCVLFILFLFFKISWRLITLQYCSGFCHTLTWISPMYF